MPLQIIFTLPLSSSSIIENLDGVSVSAIQIAVLEASWNVSKSFDNVELTLYAM
jgi:hypothetical protein